MKNQQNRIMAVNLGRKPYDTDLIEKGILDSFAILQLMTHIEETYQIEVGFDEMVSENIRSVTLLADFVNRKLGN